MNRSMSTGHVTHESDCEEATLPTRALAERSKACGNHPEALASNLAWCVNRCT